MEFGGCGESRYRVVHQYISRRDDELNINVGDVIDRVEVKEEDGGWARGQLGGYFGYFPLNHAIPVTGSRGLRCHRVLHTFTSLRAEDLDLHVGDIVQFISEVEPGWWRGRIGDKVGVFPNNYVSEPLSSDSPVVLRRSSKVKSFHASLDENLGASISSHLFQPEDEPVGELFGSFSSRLDWSTASLSSFKAAGFLGRVRKSLSTKSLVPKFLRGRLSTNSLNDKSSIESSSLRNRRNSFASFFNKSSGKLQMPPSPSPSKGRERWRRLTGFRSNCSTPLSQLDRDLRKLSLSGEKSKSARPTEQSRSWIWEEATSPPGMDLHPSTADSGVTDLEFETHEEIFGPILEITDEVFEDMFESSHDSSSKSKLSKIRTTFSSFDKRNSSSRRTTIATNPKVMWKPKQSNVDEIEVTEL